MYQPTIGLEIHIELKTKSKMFCSCLNNPNERHPNLNICPICMGHPGTLPVINKEAVRKVIKTGLALNCQIPEHSKFDRRLYFYPDLPKGYQISQWDQPLCKGGFLKIDNKKIKIKEIHLEEDVGKLIHEKDCSLVDFNRAGVPLMELDTEPNLRLAKEARKFAEELQLIVRYLGVSNADMEKGEMRCDANVSLTKTKKLGTKVEIKNLNSFKAIERSIDYEITRQTEILKSGKKIVLETRGWDEIKGVTVAQREKGEVMFAPEPDLPSLYHSREFINEIKIEIPELPQQKRERFKREYNLSEKEIEIFVFNKELGEYFEKVISELIEWVSSVKFKTKISEIEKQKLNKLASNYIVSDLQGLIKSTPFFSRLRKRRGLITPENFAEFICLIYEEKISSKIAKMVLEEMFKTGADPSHIIEEKGLVQITNETEIENIIKEVLIKNPKAVEDFKKGKTAAFQFLIGKIITESKGKANPQIIQKNLTNFLKNV
jgi:aspartyl-tRNA(Asn)/glutamyl-tRNA(Gln) amidotransferase subunit B